LKDHGMSTRAKHGAKASASQPGQTGSAFRYARVAEALLAEIERGKYAVGDLLPPELDIAEKYGISRYTAREAIRRLHEMGLITRRAGVGTMVKSTHTQSRYTASISDITELVHYSKKTRLKILGEDWVRIEGDLETLLKDAAGQRWLRFSTLRYPAGSDVPISFTEILVHPAFERIRQRIHEPNASVYGLLEDMHGETIHEVRQEISCLALSRKTAALLGARAGSPGLYVLRYYIGKADALMSLSINTYPQDRFRLSTSWRLNRRGEER
jgi:GntR family transcriptional regulator